MHKMWWWGGGGTFIAAGYLGEMLGFSPPLEQVRREPCA